ncbi:hypothetical protein [Nocardia sp. NPDC058705]|uniref:hypothetical protein n=1 Tax=Nocardia sp. NPDC058705 TaxID=3346609 RepID=UPI003697D38D
MNFRIGRVSAALGFGAVLWLAGCATPAEQPAVETSRTSLSASSTVPLETPEISSAPAPSVPSPEKPAPVTPAAPATQPAPTTAPEAYLVECLEGTPGPAIWSDGTTRYSQWCFDTRGGQQYLEEESQSGAPSNNRGYECGANGCFWPDGTPVIGADRCGRLCGEPPTSGDIQGEWAQLCRGENYRAVSS